MTPSQLDQIKKEQRRSEAEALRTRSEVNTQLKKEVDMFEEFKTVDEKHEFEIVENGFILRVNGRGEHDDWIAKSYIFDGDVDFFSAIGTLAEKDRS
mgnify:FL=1